MTPSPVLEALHTQQAETRTGQVHTQWSAAVALTWTPD